MQWYESVSGRLTGNTSYSHDMIVNFLRQEKPELSNSGYHWAINKLVQSGTLNRTGRGEYSISDGIQRREYVPKYSDEAQQLIEFLGEDFPYITFTVFETSLLNSFLNHLIGQNTIFLQVEKDSSIYIFRHLQDEAKILYKPSKKDFHLYWNPGMIVVTDLISEAPLNGHTITLEKMLVDICADKLIASTFSKAEVPDVFEQAMTQYVLDRTRMMRYARRRNKEQEIKGYMKGGREDA